MGVSLISLLLQRSSVITIGSNMHYVIFAYDYASYAHQLKLLCQPWPIAGETVLLSKTLLVPTVARLALLQTQMDNLQEEKKKEREDSCMLRQQNWVG